MFIDQRPGTSPSVGVPCDFIGRNVYRSAQTISKHCTPLERINVQPGGAMNMSLLRSGVSV